MTVRDATYGVLRDCGMVDIFANPGSTEVPFLVDLPSDLRFVLALHEGSVVGLATGYAIATSQPAFVLLHTTAGLGNAVGALATARVNRAPLVVVVGQQDRRHLALQPFLAGQLSGLAGSYPVWVDQPVLAQDVPAAVRRAWHEAATGRGPALVVVPMDDWSATTSPDLGLASPPVVRRPAAADDASTSEIASLFLEARSPALVVGAGADSVSCWTALVSLAERLGCPVWQEAFGARAGFPQDHPLFAGHLPAGRSRLRSVLASYDLVLVVGAAAFRQYPFEPGPLVPDDVTVVVLSDDPSVVHHSAASLGVVADPASTCARLAALLPLPVRRGSADDALVADGKTYGSAASSPALPRRTGSGSRVTRNGLLRAGDVFEALAERLPLDVVLVEETPSSRPDLHRIIPARSPRGFVSAAMGGLGFGLPAATGLRMGDPTRPVVAVLGDGSSLYGIHGLWSAARYRCGVLFVVLSNGGYAVMDRLAEQAGGKPPWPVFGDVDIGGLAMSFGCPALRITGHHELAETLDEVMPDLAERQEPLLLDVRISPDPERFEP